MMSIFLSTVEGLMSWLGANQHIAYAILFAGAYFETLIGPGFFIPGEIFFTAGSLLGGVGALNIWFVVAVSYAGGILGDSSSYFIGRRVGRTIFREDKKIFSLTNYKRGEVFFNRYGPRAIFLARLLGPLSWITPFFAGTYRIPYKKFLLYNIPGVIVGIGEFMVVGYFFGNQYQTVLAMVQRYTGLIVLLVIALLFARWYWVHTKQRQAFKNMLSHLFLQHAAVFILLSLCVLSILFFIMAAFMR